MSSDNSFSVSFDLCVVMLPETGVCVCVCVHVHLCAHTHLYGQVHLSTVLTYYIHVLIKFPTEKKNEAYLVKIFHAFCHICDIFLFPFLNISS